MKIQDLTHRQRADLPFEAILQGRPLLDEFTRSNGLTLLLTGLPGAGKTTLGLYLLHKMFKVLREEDQPRALLLSLVEREAQILHICELYHLEFRREADGNPVPLVCANYPPNQVPDVQKIAQDVDAPPLRKQDLLFVDGISVLGTRRAFRHQLLEFLNSIRDLDLIAILVSEQAQPPQDTFLEYAVDGIFHLSIEHGTDIRKLEIRKLRWHQHYSGPHVFRLQTNAVSQQQPGIAFFPSLKCLVEERFSADVSGLKRSFSSGVDGFDEMFHLEREGNGSSSGSPQAPFRSSEQSLLIGPIGAGNFLFGTQFLAAATDDERSILISFARRSDEIMERFERLSEENKQNDILVCQLLCFNPTQVVPEEVLGIINNLLREQGPKPTRLFIDGISALRFRFQTTEKFEDFMLGLLHLIGTFPNVATLVSFYMPKIFSSYSDIEIPIAERFANIIGFNFQEQHNRLKRGIVILKARGRAIESSLKVPDIKNGRYFVDLKAGWPRVGLLGGEREQVREEPPFVKVFFENRSEEDVLEQPFTDFSRRYPEGTIFRKVPKQNPQPSHWSFQGYAGPGHSNTKIVELRKYVMDELLQVFSDVSPEMKRLFEYRFAPGFLWPTIQSGDRSNDVTIPFYADVGVLVWEESFMREAAGVEGPPDTWKKLLEISKSFRLQPTSSVKHFFIIPSTVVDLKNFVSFFFEVCWTHGWVYPNDESSRDPEYVLHSLHDWLRGEYFAEAIDLFQEMTKSGVGIPNPNRGGHYHESVFSRRWFSKIHLFEKDAKRRVEEGKEPLRFGIAPLPGVEKDGLKLPGISNVDLYSLGIIRDALAPETAEMLASVLFQPDVDMARAMYKRGIPVSRKLFESSLIQESLDAPPPSPKEYYQKQGDLFKGYSDCLKTIVDPAARRFRRTCDIPRFFHLEKLLGESLPRLFEDPPETQKKVQRSIEEGLVEIYAPRTK